MSTFTSTFYYLRDANSHRRQKQSTPPQPPFWPRAPPPTSWTLTTATGCATRPPGFPTAATTPSNRSSLGTKAPFIRPRHVVRAPSWTPRPSSGGTRTTGARAVRSGRAMRRAVLLPLGSMGRVEARLMCRCTMSRLLTRGFGRAGMWVMAPVVMLGSCLCGSRSRTSDR